MRSGLRWPHLFSIAAGLCDTSTGVLLVLHPAFTLTIMGVHVLAEDLVYLRFIGAFVASIGAMYLLPFLARNPVRRDARLAVALELTAFSRFAIGTFVVTAVSLGALTTPWILVALTDLSLALVQIPILIRGGLGDL